MDGLRQWVAVVGMWFALGIPGFACGAEAALSFEPRPEEEDAELHDVQFVTSKLGFAVGDHGVVWRTADGGETWQFIRTGVPCSLRSLCFITDRFGWIAGGGLHPFTKSPYGLLLVTEDRGQTWRRLTALPIFQESTRAERIAATASRGEAPARRTATATPEKPQSREGSGDVAPAENQVSLSAIPASLPTLPRLTQVRFFDRQQGYVLGAPTPEFPTGILLTNDGGKSFQTLPGELSGNWVCASFTQPGQGIAVGLRGACALVGEGQILRTRLNNISPRGLFGVKLHSSGAGWLVGDGGLVLQTRNHGLVWQSPPTDLPEGVSRVFDFRAVATCEDHVWIAGEPGSVVWHSPDGGRTWNRGATRQTAPLTALAFSTPQRGWAAGALGALLKTEDGGATWRAVRGRQRRLALLSLTTRATHSPVSLLALLGGDQGYRTAVVQIAREDVALGIDGTDDRQAALQQGVLFCGGNAGRTSWQFPLGVPGLERNSERLLADWNRRTEGKLSARLIGHLVCLLRTWRPSVVLLEEPGPDDALAQTVQQAALHAIEQAADPEQHLEQQELAGLAAWSVAKIFTRLPSSANGALRLDPHEVLTHLGGTAQLVSAPSRALLLSEAATGGQQETYKLLESHIPNLREDLAARNFFTGLNLQPGSAARRELLRPNEQLAELTLELAQRQRNFNSITTRFGADDRMSNQLVAQLPALLKDMPAPQGALQLQQLAETYLAQGRVDLAEQTWIEQMDRFPAEPITAQGMVWLLHYWGSQEATWQKVRREQVGKSVATPNTEAAQVRLAHAAAKIRRQVATQQRSIIPVGGVAEPTVPAVAPSEFREHDVRGRIDPRVQFEAWDRRAADLGALLQARLPELYRQPQVQFPIAAVLRRNGGGRASDEIFRRFLPANGLEGEGVAARELWLVRPVAALLREPLVCSRTEARPVLDGVLSDPCWQRASEAVLTEPGLAAPPGDRHAFVMLAYDDEYLYIAASLPREAGTRTDGRIDRPRRHDENLQDFDRLRILLDVDRDYFTWYDLTIDQRGCTADACWQDRRWNPKWYVASDAEKSHWRLEAALPLSELAWQKPERGTIWALSLIRTVPAVTVQSWFPAPRGEPGMQSFGLLRFD